MMETQNNYNGKTAKKAFEDGVNQARMEKGSDILIDDSERVLYCSVLSNLDFWEFLGIPEVKGE